MSFQFPPEVTSLWVINATTNETPNLIERLSINFSKLFKTLKVL